MQYANYFSCLTAYPGAYALPGCELEDGGLVFDNQAHEEAAGA